MKAYKTLLEVYLESLCKTALWECCYNLTYCGYHIIMYTLYAVFSGGGGELGDMTGCADQLMGWQISSHQQSPDLSHDTSDDQPHDTSADDYDDDDDYYNDEYYQQVKVSTQYALLFFENSTLSE